MELLSIKFLILIPILAAIIILLPIFPNHEVKIRRFAKVIAALHFIYTLCFLVFFDPNTTGYQFVETIKMPNGENWLEPIGSSLSFGVDGISLTLIILTSFLVLISMIASKSNIRHKQKLYYPLVFILQTAITGVFCAKDLFLFFIFWEIELIPMYFLISLWGSGRKDYSAMKFILYTFTGSIFMLLAIFAVYIFHYIQTGTLTFDLDILTAVKTYTYPTEFMIWTFLGFFIAFAVKLPIVPLHTWLPDAHVDAPTPVSMLLAGILLKMGSYGLIRMNLQILPEAFKIMAPVLVIVGVINIIYAAIIAIAQEDMKKLIAYSSISHMGLVLVGLGALNIAGVSGAVFQMIAHGLISAGLFMCVGSIYLRTHTRKLPELGGLGQVMPKMHYFNMVIAMASLGLPLLIGFAAETLIIYGAFTSHAFESIQLLTIIALIGIILTAAYILWMIQQAFHGTMLCRWKKISDITPHEVVVLLSITLTIIAFGIYPQGLTKFFTPAIEQILSMI